MSHSFISEHKQTRLITNWTSGYLTQESTIFQRAKGYATRNNFGNDFVTMHALDAIFATLKSIVDDEIATISLRVA